MENRKKSYRQSIDRRSKIVFIPLFAAMAIILICFIIFHSTSEKLYYKTAKHYGELSQIYTDVTSLHTSIVDYSRSGGNVKLNDILNAQNALDESVKTAQASYASYDMQTRDLLHTTQTTLALVEEDIEYLTTITDMGSQRSYAGGVLLTDATALVEDAQALLLLSNTNYCRSVEQNKLMLQVLTFIIAGTFVFFCGMGIYMLFFVRKRVVEPALDIVGWAKLFQDDYAEMADLKMKYADELCELADSFNHVKARLIEANQMKVDGEKALRKLREEEAYHEKYVRKFHEEKREKDDISARAKRDGLTGLYNRRSFDDLVEEFLRTKPAKTQGALYLIDMDFFKNVNDTLGHIAGDEALKKLGGTMSIVFPGAYLGRYGGDEFVAFMTMGNPDVFRVKANELCHKMDTEFVYGNNSVHISVSVGVVSTEGISDYSELYMKVDRALYYAKEHGRNRFCYAEDLAELDE